MTILGGLIQNASLLLALVLAYSLIIDYLPRKRLATPLLYGSLFGMTAVLGMTSSVPLGSGVIFDARTVVMAIGGVFSGAISAAVAATIASAYRAWIGGAGTIMGIAMILTASGLGLALRALHRNGYLQLNARTLGLFGLVVHIASLSWILLLPAASRSQVLSEIALPFLVVFPAFTLLTGMLLRMQEQRHQEEQALRRSQARLIEAQRIAGIGDWHWNLDTGQQQWSPELLKLYGRDPTLPPLPFPASSGLYTDRTWRRLSGAIETTIKTGESLACDAALVRPDGTQRWIRVRGEASLDAEGRTTRLRGTMQDITEQEELRQRIEKIAAHVPGMIYQYQQWPDGRTAYPYASQGINAIYGVEPGDVVEDATPVFRMLHPDDLQWVKDSIMRSMHHLDTWHERYRVRFADDRTIWVEGESSPEPQPDGSVLWHGYVHDVTSAMRSEERLKESQHKLLQAQYIARIGDFEWEIATGKVQWSEGMYHLLGYDLDETIDDSKVNSDIHHPDDLARVTQWLQDNIASGADKLAPYEHRLLRKDGNVIEVRTEGGILRQDGRATKVFGTCFDITDRKQAEAQLQLAASVFAHSREGIIITDAKNRILRVNPSFSRITGYAEAEVLGRNPKLLASGRHDKAFYARLWRALQSHGFWQGEIWNRRQNGEIYPEMLSVSVVRDASGAIQNYIGVFTDISQLKAHEAELDHIAHHDHLTGVPNRRLLTDRLNQAIAHSRRTGRALAVCYLDLDGFKELNDRHGHATGDRLLISIAKGLQQALRGEDTIARLGGDEFVLLLADLAKPDDCVGLLNRILAVTRQPLDIGDTSCSVTVSIGVTLCPPDRADADALLRHADQAMYRAKEAGKNTYHIYDAEQDRVIQARRLQREQIRRALENQELRLYFQPQVDLISRQVVCVEALIRWLHPDRGLLMPGAFLPDIQGSTLEVAVGEWVIQAAIQQYQDWLCSGLRIPISINIGANHLLRPNFAAKLQQEFAAHPGLDPGQFELEILETAALSDIEQAMNVVAECKSMGLGIAMDDFGTGYSSLAYLRRLPGDVLKIDRSFVRDMLTDPGDMEIVESVVRLSHTFGRTVVAEGVETLKHAALLTWLGCRRGQGFGIARPLPAQEVPEWIKQWSARHEWPELEIDDATADHYPELPILAVAQNHRWWMHRIHDALAQATAEGLAALGPDHCPFDRWYQGLGKDSFGGIAEFRLVGDSHDRLHRLVGDLASRLQTDDSASVAASDRQQLQIASDTLMADLRRLALRIRMSSAPNARGTTTTPRIAQPIAGTPSLQVPSPVQRAVVPAQRSDNGQGPR